MNSNIELSLNNQRDYKILLNCSERISLTSIRYIKKIKTNKWLKNQTRSRVIYYHKNWINRKRNNHLEMLIIQLIKYYDKKQENEENKPKIN